MSTFDMLPPELRKVLANANHNWSCEEAYDAFLFDVDADDLIERIQRLDGELAEEHYAILSAGLPFPN